jgi:hypothetical protein
MQPRGAQFAVFVVVIVCGACWHLLPEKPPEQLPPPQRPTG